MKLRAGTAIVVVILLGWLGWHQWGPRHTPLGQPPLAIVSPTSLGAFIAQVNASPQTTRLVLLLSPT